MKNLEFEIAYVKDGKVVFERITANCYLDAKIMGEKKGELLKCEYIHTANDLLYLH